MCPTWERGPQLSLPCPVALGPGLLQVSVSPAPSGGGPALLAWVPHCHPACHGAKQGGGRGREGEGGSPLTCRGQVCGIRLPSTHLAGCAHHLSGLHTRWAGTASCIA